MSNKVILVTGANGFIGKALVKSLCLNGYVVRAAVRSASAVSFMLDYQKQQQLTNLTIYNVGDLSETTNWHDAIDHVDTIVHCAARAHVLRETSTNPLETFRQQNTQSTANLAQQASDLGVRRFIFLSSIGVLGNNSYETPFTDVSIPNPQVPYAQAKWEAEQALHALPDDMDKIIIRPPNVYGSGVKGNFKALLNIMKKPFPIPLGAVKNKRQFLGVDNLVDFVTTCIESTKAINDTFLLADQEIISTTQLLRNISLAMGKRTILLPVPHRLLDWMLKSIGKSKMAGQLLGNLEIQSSKAYDSLGWKPPYTMQEQLNGALGRVACKKPHATLPK